jgi:predicted Zn-dependent protease
MKITRKHASIALLGTLCFFLCTACGLMGENSQSKGFNLFTLDQDRALGAQVAHEIDSNKREYPILDSVQYKSVYQYLYKVRDNILNSGQVTLRNEFGWKLHVIHNDSVLNAFCTPGGYIYIYTGILKYLDSEDQLAGVLGHEIGHADLRHSTRQMTEMFGIQLLLDVLAGDRIALKQISGALIGLKFSRAHETQADECSVRYLCPTAYNAARPPEFLSTHPDPGNRIEHFTTSKSTMGCTGENTFASEYKAMLAKLPK